jgi:hypothetical protein
LILGNSCPTIPKNKMQNEKDRQCMYNKTLRGVHVTTVAMEKQ